MKRIYVILASVCLLYSCSDKQEFENAEFLKFNEINASSQSLETNDWLTKLSEKLAADKTFSSLDENTKRIFFESVLFNSKGQVISFVLDSEKVKLANTAYNNLLLYVLDEDAVKIVDGDKQYSIIKNSSHTTIISGNPPITYKNKRNNNVGGCDKFKGSVCVIRW